MFQIEAVFIHDLAGSSDLHREEKCISRDGRALSCDHEPAPDGKSCKRCGHELTEREWWIVQQRELEREKKD